MTADRPTTEPRTELPWNESNPEWWKMQVEERGEEYAWLWLVNEWADTSVQNASFRAMQRTLNLMDEEWQAFIGSKSRLTRELPEDSMQVPWPVRNFVRRIREALND